MTSSVEKDIEKYFNKIDNCPLCRSKTSTNMFSLKQLVFDVNVVKCRSCGLLYKLYQPSESLIQAIYSTSYTHFFHKEVKSNIAGVLNSRVHRMGVVQKDHKRHLDYGCGAGAFVKASLEAGWDSYGCDPYLPDNNVDCLISDRLYRYNIKDNNAVSVLGKFDIISMWAVVEHIPDPISTFYALSNMMEPGGKLIFNWPYGDSIASRKKGHIWSMALLLEHLTFCTNSSIHYLAKELHMSIDKIVVCGSPYPIGVVRNPILKDQGIEKLPFRAEPAVTVTDKYEAQGDTKLSLKNVALRVRSYVLSHNSGGLIANLLRYFIKVMRIGDHIEVILVKEK